jgi:transposase
MEKELFNLALGICEPVYIDKVVFDSETGELHIHMNFKRGGRFECSECGATDLPVYDTVEKTWRHLNFFQYKCYIHMRTPRTSCPKCGERQWLPPWTRNQSGFTVLFEAFVMVLSKAMPVAKIGELFGEHDTRIWRIVSFHVNKAYKKKSFSAVKKVGCDETSSRKGHNYVTVFANTENGEVLFATKGKDSSTIKAFVDELPKHDGKSEEIKEVSIDMSHAFISGVCDYLPESNITFDKFHVIQMLNKAQDEVRRMEQKENPLLKSSRYVWLKNEENLSKKQKEQLETLRLKKLKTAKVYQMKLVFQDIYRSVVGVEEAEKLIKKWLSWAVRSRLEPIKRFARMVKSHFDGIMRYFETRLTSGLMESINSRIQNIKRRARGYRNIDNFISMIYLETAGLEIELPT